MTWWLLIKQLSHTDWVEELHFSLGSILLRNNNLPWAAVFSWQPPTAVILFGYFLFLPAILSFLFFNSSLQRVWIQRISSSSQYLVNPEKLPSGPILTVRYKNSHPERLPTLSPLWFELMDRFQTKLGRRKGYTCCCVLGFCLCRLF